MEDLPGRQAPVGGMNGGYRSLVLVLGAPLELVHDAIAHVGALPSDRPRPSGRSGKVSAGLRRRYAHAENASMDKPVDVGWETPVGHLLHGRGGSRALRGDGGRGTRRHTR